MTDNKAKPRILIDARKIFDGGIGVYLQNLLEACYRQNQLTLLVNPAQVPLIKQKDFNWLKDVSFFEDSAKVLSFDEYFNLAKRIPQQDFDLYHTPFITLPFGLKLPAVITVHDLIQITHPEKFYYKTFAKFIMASSVRRAKRVLTVSQTSADLLKKYFTVDSKLQVVRNATQFSDAKGDKIDKYGNYLLAIFSNLKPHKGLDDLIRAFAELKNEASSALPPDLKLLLVGSGFQATESFAVGDDVVVLGAVSDQELGDLYASANALLVSSYVEGFCLPVLEAHAQGTAVIARPEPAVKELLTEYDYLAKDFTLPAYQAAIKEFYQINRQFDFPELIQTLDDFKI
ncbi:glycosyltransferase family 4 protein, partial [Oligoflexia bacterium]|nr:glycosyltransferase family 4 protein [Oligoflexia bacterium]